jgi:TRAP-type C4-dicarboxylate transport system permease small subunit
MLEGVTIGLLAAMCASTLMGVADRFLLGIGLPWPEELSRFLLVWTSLLAAVVAAKRRAHFRVTLLLDRLGRRGAVLVDVLCLFVLAVVLGYGVQLAWIFHAQKSPALGIPMSLVYAAVPVSALLIAGYVVGDLIKGGATSLPAGK